MAGTPAAVVARQVRATRQHVLGQLLEAGDIGGHYDPTGLAYFGPSGDQIAGRRRNPFGL